MDGRADVYSVGCLLYECLTGEHRRSRAGRDSESAWAHLEKEPPSASDQRPGLPPAIDQVVAAAMAKDPASRPARAAVLVDTAERALGLDPPVHRGAGRTAAVAAVLAVAVAIAVAAFALTRDRGAAGEVRAPANSLVRIDPGSNRATLVVHLSSAPMATAAAGRSVWAYSAGQTVLSEFDAEANQLRSEVVLAAPPLGTDLLSGPVLAADAGGAWVVGSGDAGDGVLTRVLAGGGGKREYRIAGEPRAVAVDGRGVWVITRETTGDLLLRVNSKTGEVMRQARFASRIDSLAVGLGAVWALGSSDAVLHRLEPRSLRRRGSLDLGERAGRVYTRFGRVWAGVSDQGGVTVLVHPQLLSIAETLNCCPLGEGYDTATGYGSLWTYDYFTGTVMRFGGSSHQVVHATQVTTPPGGGGACLTSIAAGAGGVWATTAPVHGSGDAACAR